MARTGPDADLARAATARSTTERPEAPPDHRQEGNRPMLIAMILLSVTLAAVAQLTLKHGMDQVTETTGALRFDASHARAVAVTPAVWLGLALFAAECRLQDLRRATSLRATASDRSSGRSCRRLCRFEPHTPRGARW